MKITTKGIIGYLILLLIGTQFINTSFSQKINMEYEFSGNIDPEFIGFPNDQNNVVVSYRTYSLDVAKTYKTHLLFQSGGKVRDFPLFGKLKFTGHSYDDDSYTFLYRHDNVNIASTSEIELIQFSKSGEKIMGKGVMTFNKELPISRFHYEGKYYFLSLDRKQRKFIVRIVHSASNIEKYEFDIDLKTFRNLVDVPLQLAHNDHEIPVDRTLSNQKVFFHEGKLFLGRAVKLDNNEKGINLISLENGLAKAKTLKVPFQTFNHFPYRDQLFVIDISSKVINLHVHDINTLQKLHEFSFPVTSESIDIINSEVFKNDDLMEYKLNKSRNEQKMKWLSNGYEFISVTDKGDKIKLTYGSFLYDASADPVRSVYDTFESPNSTKYYAYGYLNSSDYSVIKERAEQYDTFKVIDKFIEQAKSNKEKVKFYNVYATKNRSYLVYYTKGPGKTKKVMVREWE